jgi:NAD(P)-dependent dehydrogenase (short-subunit alcohol dehydrogenase family)
MESVQIARKLGALLAISTASTSAKAEKAHAGGGTTGIGLAAAKLFVREDAYVFITNRRQKELDEAVKAIGSNVTGVQGDVAKLADLDRLYETDEQMAAGTTD